MSDINLTKLNDLKTKAQTELIKSETQLITLKRKTETIKTIALVAITFLFACFVYKVDTQTIIDSCTNVETKVQKN